MASKKLIKKYATGNNNVFQEASDKLPGVSQDMLKVWVQSFTDNDKEFLRKEEKGQVLNNIKIEMLNEGFDFDKFAEEQKKILDTARLQNDKYATLVSLRKMRIFVADTQKNPDVRKIAAR